MYPPWNKQFTRISLNQVPMRQYEGNSLGVQEMQSDR